MRAPSESASMGASAVGPASIAPVSTPTTTALRPGRYESLAELEDFVARTAFKPRSGIPASPHAGRTTTRSRINARF
jgi:hypothetical protein